MAIDLFSGCGGMSLGLIKAGFDVIAAAEWAPEAIHTYLVNLGAYPVKMIFSDDEARARMETYFAKQFKAVMKRRGNDFSEEAAYHDGHLMSGSNRKAVTPEFAGVRFMFVGDIREFSGTQILEEIGLRRGEVDLIAGGPPCQGFSKANAKRSAMDPRNDLVFEFLRLVLEIQPKTMMMENVPEMAKMTTPEGIPIIEAISKILNDNGFGEYDAVKRALTGMPGSRAVFRSGKSPSVPDVPGPARVTGQGELFQ